MYYYAKHKRTEHLSVHQHKNIDRLDWIIEYINNKQRRKCLKCEEHESEIETHSR